MTITWNCSWIQVFFKEKFGIINFDAFKWKNVIYIPKSPHILSMWKKKNQTIFWSKSEKKKKISSTFLPLFSSIPHGLFNNHIRNIIRHAFSLLLQKAAPVHLTFKGNFVPVQFKWVFWCFNCIILEWVPEMISSWNYWFYDHSFGNVSIVENENAANVYYGYFAYRQYIWSWR